MRTTPLQEAVRRAGSVTKLAAGLGIASQAVSQWRRVPAARVLEVERITGVARHELRPDIYPPEVPHGPERGAVAKVERGQEAA